MATKGARLLIWWRRSGMGLRLTLFVVVGALLSLLVYWQRPDDDTAHLANNLLVFFLVNSIIVVLCVLIFLIGRNVVKLIFDRRRKILGSKLRLRLVTAFVSLTLVPTAILFFLASGLLSRSMEGWFSGQVEGAVSSAVGVAKQHHQLLRDIVAQSAADIKGALPAGGRPLEGYLEEVRRSKGLFGVQILTSSGQEVMRVQNAAGLISDFQEPLPDKAAVQRAASGRESVLFEEDQGGQFIRAYLPLKDGAQVLMVSKRIDPEFSQALTTVNDSFKEYEQLKLFKNPLKSAYILTLTMITMIILFSAIWFGFYIAREISVPIQHIAEGTRAVARGNLDFRIKEGGDDEIAFLVRSFNTMIADLKHSRAEAESRRLHLEAVLSNLAVSVIAFDSEHKVTSVNPAASKLFGLADPVSVRGRAIEEVVGPEMFEQLSGLVSELEHGQADKGAENIGEKEISMVSGGKELKLVCTVGKVLDPHGRWQATVLIFDDITEISKAQHMSAWREVAQRIAHEIKNPLTPIQLAAQRLQKLLADSKPAPAVTESTQTIIENVNSIKRLANEFSNFARMPIAEFQQESLNDLVSDTLAPFAEDHNGILFQFIADSKLPKNLMDREQIRRLLINLIDNAIAAVASRPAESRDPPKVVLKTYYHAGNNAVILEVADNGAGIPEGSKARIFEPYYTTKSGGTGLGLAIVSSVVSDHQGEIRLFDNHPRGAKFVVELPVEPRAYTQRRLAGI
ncbi:MAG: HAMP domain-containing protein [Deltaproteobacteria bacterium]|nr:HAMP domain-containing protein [Deltaproteobacteria bacterium]